MSTPIDVEPRWRRWGRRAAGVLLVWLGLWGFLSLSDGQVQPVLLGGTVLTAAVLAWVTADTGRVTSATDWTPTYVSPRARVGSDPRFSRLSRLLGEGSDRITVSDTVHSTIRGLATERLARKHGVDLVDQPDQAATLLGRELYDYISKPARRIRGNDAARLSRLLSRIEAL